METTTVRTWFDVEYGSPAAGWELTRYGANLPGLEAARAFVQEHRAWFKGNGDQLRIVRRTEEVVR